MLLVAACGDVASVTKQPDPIGTGGTSMDTGGTGGTGTGGTGGGIVGVGGSTNNGGQGNEGGGGPEEDAVCGNDKLEMGELCDDGNTDDDDGCSADCQVADPDFLCTEGKGCVRVVTCGNGIIEGDEACDDHNTDDDDGCSGDCSSIDDGFICVKPGEPCVEQPVCGNGVREQGEQCDDKNEKSGDGCSKACQLEDGYFCPPGAACVVLACGDGNRTPDEPCDDGNNDGGDGCAADCTVEAGWLCSSSGCKPICGDGKVLGPEKCDDGNSMSGDGCSGACKVEPYHSCDSGEPSTCMSTVVCGDGIRSPGEVCDPAIPGQEDCFSDTTSACKAYHTNGIAPPVCNNGVVEYMEECDGGSGNIAGCTNCVLDPAYVCPTAGVCFKKPVCGDGELQAGEECDLDLASGPGCIDCKIQSGWFCSGEPSVCVHPVCGDGVLGPNEQCDDGDTDDLDGCDHLCRVETGYACPPGEDCLAICGDGIKTAPEECDLGASPNATACKNCKLQSGWQCGSNGLGPCAKTKCPSTVGTATPPEPGEGCDDGNTIAGDGCGPTCQLEPVVSPTTDPNDPTKFPTVALTCGDGLKTTTGQGVEGCDDGNATDGDGCSSSCAVESGWNCTDVLTRPATVQMAVTLRDFKSNGVPGGHPHFERTLNDNKGMVGAVCTNTNQATCGRLDGQGKPTLSGTPSSTPGGSGSDTAASRFATWYRDTNTKGYTISVIHDSLVLTQDATDPNVYGYDSDNNNPSGYWPLDGRGNGTTCGNEVSPTCCNAGGACVGHNFGFTTELRYFFKYQGGETLTFRGDDDVWVFINGRLAVDVGGVHCAQAGRVVLGDEDSSCTLNGTDYDSGDCKSTGTLPVCDSTMYTSAEQADSTDSRFNITKGGVYEIVLFQAERHTQESNFRLTLAGFLAPRSQCDTDCGDSIKAGSEMCDEGRSMPASGYDTCLNNCTIQFCGDKSQNGPEQCDNGTNADLYGTSGCAPGCLTPPKCGDGKLQVNAGEECDNGTAQNTGGYNGCTSSCKLGPYCGDGNVSNGEQCDTPGAFDTYGQGKCNYNCQNAPYCGDGIRNGPEQCDGTPGCTASCELAAFCGDGNPTSDEACDYGPANLPPADAQYGDCTTDCELGPHCGDGTLQKVGGEECDDGADNADNVYDGCNTSCLFGPHCGDGIQQEGAGEACDNGFNEDDYAYPGAATPCGKGCTAVPSCGDGKLQSAFELCDNGRHNSDTAYDGCTTTCEWGPYCGDGTKNGPEQCDDGVNNTAYSADGKGCSYECTKDVPSCGDGIRNGPEQCDDGTAQNDGRYGGCNDDCTRASYCGDHKIQKGDGEQCDDGPTGSLSCSPQCKLRDGGVR